MVLPVKNSIFSFRLQIWILVITLSQNLFSTTEESHKEMELKSSEKHSEMHKASHHSPIGVMGGEYHKKGEFMFSLRFMKMKMKGNRQGEEELSDYQVISFPNSFAMGNMPSKISVVPKEMEMNMSMASLMYGFNNRVTGMAMLKFVNKNMKLNTYNPVADLPCVKIYPSPPECRSFLGSFNSSSSGLASFIVSMLIKLKETKSNRWHVELGFEKSIGKNDTKGEVLSPANTKMNIVLPYSMQTGDKGTRLVTGLTFVQRNMDWTYGIQTKLNKTINQEKWNYGNSLSMNGWIQKGLSHKTSLSFRYSYLNQKTINGKDMMIMAPVQTSNPKNYGGRFYEIGVGVNRLINFEDSKHGNRVGLELVYPLKQDLNGLQMQRDWSVRFGYQTFL